MYRVIVETMNLRPMVMISSIFILGIFIQDRLRVGSSILFLMFVMGLIILPYLQKNIKRVLLVVLILIAGCFRLAVRTASPVDSLLYLIPDADSIYHVMSIVDGVGETKRGTPKYVLSPYRVDGKQYSEGRVILYAKDLSCKPSYGDTLKAHLQLNIPRARRNPHDFNYRVYLERQEIFFEAFIQDSNSVQIRSPESVSAVMHIHMLKESILSHFRTYLTTRSSGILSALILGERSDVDEETRTDFANTGVIHVLAVSGLHVGYVAMILLTIFGIFRFPHRLKMSAVIFGLIFYVFLTGAAASVMRASIMASLLIIGALIERKADVYNVLATAALLILLIDPLQLKNIGFQLSFSAVLSIVALFPKFKSWLPEMRLLNGSSYGRGVLAVIDLFLVSLAAQLGTLALTIYYFHKIPIISILANIIVVPLIGIVVATGMSFLLLGVIFPILAELWSHTLEGTIDIMLWFVRICANVEWAYVNIPAIQSTDALLLLFGIFLVAMIPFQRVLKFWLFLFLIWGNMVIWRTLLVQPKLELIMLDVGQGDALVIHTPNDKTIVIDAGLRFGGQDMGKDIILPYLLDRNWLHINLLVLTHPHNDHMGGAEYLASNLQIDRVLLPDIEYDSYGYNKLIGVLDSLEIPKSALFTGAIDSSLKPLYLRVMAPKMFTAETQPSNVNNSSIVIQLFYNESTVMLTGDAEAAVEADQLAFGTFLKSNIMKAPHHGSKTSSTLKYLKLTRPDVALMSLAENNKFRHPAATTLKKYESIGTRVNRTDLEGAIIYTSDGVAWSKVRWRDDN
ncbi:MAG: DNA internalization-related competence protein ComEC/Rec2 [Candidatus Marinimicrobia bacterium]|nr:DNA internalization-related competence protein ComEC/Rec2 [Candidatus Neomarinimicrobiota bacterium]